MIKDFIFKIPFILNRLMAIEKPIMVLCRNTRDKLIFVLPWSSYLKSESERKPIFGIILTAI
jgi:hypothetical protein